MALRRDAEFEEIEQVETGRVERILAVGMVVFLLIGGVWTLNRMSSLVPHPDMPAIEAKHGTAKHNDTLNRLRLELQEADRLYAEEADRLAKSQAAYEFRREEYRVLLESGKANDAAKSAWELAREDYEAALTRRDVAVTVRDRARGALADEERAENEKRRLVFNEYESAVRLRELKLFLLRCAYTLPVFILALTLWQRMRRTGSRHLILATAFLAFATIQAVVVAAQYSYHLLRGYMQLAVSLAGTVLTAFGLVALRRYVLNPERLARSRLKRGQCPHCGFPRTAGKYCVSCGGIIEGACPNCGNPRPVNAPHCPSCGSA
ncbi:MAG: hypothetical protein HPY55_14530 [Firmicutes bacterium]|nr:hypothetical protein [Bacillota bacterium]